MLLARDPLLSSGALRQTNMTPGLRYRNLGKSGLRVSNVGLGTWVTFGPGVTESEAENVVVLAYESGVNLFDVSEAHCGPRAELELGRILQRRGWKRSSYVVCTKIYWNSKSDERGLSRKHIIESVKASLARLQLAYIDVVLIHKADPMCPMEEVVRAMHHVVCQGWAMYWGTARWTPGEVMEAYSNCRQFNCTTPVCEQAEYHLFCRDKAELYMPELYNKIGVGLMAWSPLTMGLISGKFDEAGFPLISRSSFKSKRSSYSWTEDETTAAASKEVRESQSSLFYTMPHIRTHVLNTRTRGSRSGWSRRSCAASRTGSARSAWWRSGWAAPCRSWPWPGASRTRACSACCSAPPRPRSCTRASRASRWDHCCCRVAYRSRRRVAYPGRGEHAAHTTLAPLCPQLVPKLNATTMTDLERILDNKPTRPPIVSTLALR
ncbi:hypothetical protein FOCC_FOCC015621 [Frankliniella occidentalis]|nr:hypothetical protein FOCC_FOCC015621 [Frankliniella occidentalis]